MKIEQQLSLLRQVKLANEAVAEAWGYIIEAVSDQHVNIDMLLKAFTYLEGGSGVSGWNEFSIDVDDENPDLASVYYLPFQPSSVTCRKVDLLDAYHQLQKLL